MKKLSSLVADSGTYARQLGELYKELARESFRDEALSELLEKVAQMPTPLKERAFVRGVLECSRRLAA